MDNFSRKILAWKLADSVRAQYRQASIEQAIKSVKGVNSSITLITDGGPENNLKSFLKESSYPIEHQRALVDVHYSNSLIEAHNKIIKYNYLYRMHIYDGGQLQKVLSQIVDDFNSRPHISLGGLTPAEAEQNLSLDRGKLCANVRQATVERKTYNQLHQCDHCKN